MKKVAEKKEFDQEIQLPEKLKEKISKINEEKEKINREIDQSIYNLVEGFLSDKDVLSDSKIILRLDLGIIGIVKNG